MARVRLTYVTPNGQIFPIDIAQEDDLETIDKLLSMVLIVDAKAQEKGMSIMGKKLETTPTGAKAAAPPKADGVREGNILYKVVSIDILPKPNGQVQVAFFGDDFAPGARNRFATLFVDAHESYPVEKLRALLAPYHQFKLETFKMAGTYNVDFIVEYYETEKVNSKGNPYKNVVRIHVKDGAKKPSVGQAPAPQPDQAPSDGAIQPSDIPF